MDDYEAKLNALLQETQPVFEELADSCETVARAIRAMNLLMTARAEPEFVTPHLTTALHAFAALSALHPRLDAILKNINA